MINRVGICNDVANLFQLKEFICHQCKMHSTKYRTKLIEAQFRLKSVCNAAGFPSIIYVPLNVFLL